MTAIARKSIKGPSSFKKYGILIGTGIAGIVVAIDFTIVSTILPVIQKALGANIGQLQWMIAGFGLTFCSCLVAGGKLGDNYGHLRLLYIGIIGFGIASLLAGLAQTPSELIACRLFQGLFGSPVFPCGMALVARAFPQEQQGRAIASYTALVGIGLAIGPVMGGAITSILSWRWVFFFNIPTVIVALIVCFIWAEESEPEKSVKIDWGGMLSLMVLLAFLVYGITQGPINGWTSDITLGSLALGILGILLFVWIERQATAPLIPVQYIFNPNFLLGMVLNGTAVGFSYIVVFLLSLYLHLVKGYTSGYVGMTIFPMTLMTLIMPYIAGYFLDKHGPRLVSMTIILLVIAAFLLFTSFSQQSAVPLIIISSVLFGLAWGLANGSAIPIALTHITPSNVAVVSGAQITMLNMFGVFSIAIGGSILNHVMFNRIASLFGTAGVSLSSDQVHSLVKNALSGTDDSLSVVAKIVPHSADKAGEYLQMAFLSGFKDAALFFAIVAILLVGVVWWALKKRSSR